MPTRLSAETQGLLNDHRVRCAREANRIGREYGSAGAFFDSLVVEMLDSPDDPRLEEFYSLYAAVFPLEEEREPVEGFSKVLSFNADASAQAAYGPFYEPITILRDRGSGSLVGAANFSIYTYDRSVREAYAIDASCQLHFLMIAAELRGLGLATRLLDLVAARLAAHARQVTGKRSVRTFMTCEQNNPARMTPEQIEEDARAALIDPDDRMAWWRKRGFRRLDLAYVQPPLSASHAPCDYLDLYARLAGDDLDARPASLPAAVLLEHIRRFFYVSVGKLEGDMSANPEWLGIRSDLVQRAEVSLV